MQEKFRIIRQDPSGKIIEEINIDPKDIKDNEIAIKATHFGGGTLHKLKIVETPYEVKVPVFKDHEVLVDKVRLIDKPRVVEVPNFIRKDIVVTNVTVDEVKKKITIYELVKVKVRVPVIEEYIVKVPKLIYVDTEVPNLVKVDIPFPNIIYSDVIIDNPILNERQVDTCVINHICPHCKKKAQFIPETIKKE